MFFPTDGLKIISLKRHVCFFQLQNYKGTVRSKVVGLCETSVFSPQKSRSLRSRSSFGSFQPQKTRGEQSLFFPLYHPARKNSTYVEVLEQWLVLKEVVEEFCGLCPIINSFKFISNTLHLCIENCR